MKDRLHTFDNAAIEVTWSKARCIHAAECVAGLAAVFQPGERPWIKVDAASADAIADTVTRCPTGALHFTRRDGGPSEARLARNEIRVSRNGPLYLRGDIEVRNARGEVVLRDSRVALCRCGASANKPVCDNAHREARFRDAGVVAEPDGVAGGGGAPEGVLVVTPQPNGPFELTGPFTLLDVSGKSVAAGTSTALCRCGNSSNKPFCDGSHVTTGFVAD